MVIVVPEDRKPKWIEKLEKEIGDLRSDVNGLADFVRKMNKYEKGIGERLLDVVNLLQNHKDNEAILMALQAMRGSLNIDKELEEVREYARERRQSVKEAYEEMTTKGILPQGLREFVKAKKIIREML